MDSEDSLANGVIDLRRQGPSTGAQIADLGQNMLQFFMQREQLELQKEQQGLREKAFKQDLAERQAEQQRIQEAQAGQAAALETFLAQNPQAAQQLQQAGVQVPGGAGAAPLLQGLQQQQQQALQGRQIEAQITGIEAQAEASRAQTEVARARIPLEQKRLEIDERLAGIQELATRSEAELNRAQARKLETERKVAPIQIATEIAKERRDMFAAGMREFGDPAMASFIAYGSAQRPNEKAMVEQIAGTVSSVIQGDNFDPAAARQLAMGDPMTDFGTRLGIGPSTIARYAGSLEQLGDKPSAQSVNQLFQQTAAQIDAIEMVPGPGGVPQPVSQEQKDAQKAAAKFFMERATGQTIRVPEKEKNRWVEFLKRSLGAVIQGIDTIGPGAAQPGRQANVP